MSEAHKRSYRHPAYKTAYRVRNWPEYDKALRDRGDTTLWLSQGAIEAWTASKTRKRGGQQVYSDIAIEPFIQDAIVPGTLVYTDEYSIYARLQSWGYGHKRVHHGRGEFARDEDGDGFAA